MVLRLKPMGKPTTQKKKLSFGQNQGIAWSSDSNLWGNQLLLEIKFWIGPRYCIVLGLKLMGKPTTSRNQVLDRTKVLHGPRTQTYGETNYFQKSSFGQNQGIAWSLNSNLQGNQLLINVYQVLDRTKALHGPRTQTYGEVSYLRRILSRSVLGPNTKKGQGYESSQEDGETPYYSTTNRGVHVGLYILG